MTKNMTTKKKTTQNNLCYRKAVFTEVFSGAIRVTAVRKIEPCL